MVNEGWKARVSTSARRGLVSRRVKMLTRQNVRKIPRPLGRVMVRATILDSDGLSSATDASWGKVIPPGPASPLQGADTRGGGAQPGSGLLACVLNGGLCRGWNLVIFRR